jgi:CDP-diacylglycerol--serine O-phosphatidyltransferase
MDAKKIKMFTLPNFVTLANLACGCAAIMFACGYGHQTNVAFWFIAAAAVFDFLDGFTARLTGQYSALGVQLDSLADMVSFGVAPSVVLFEVYESSVSAWWNISAPLSDGLGWLVFVVALFSALRLAKFNIDDTQKSEFVGLPVPANALLIAGLGWMVYSLSEFNVPREVWLALAAVMSYLLICPLRMFSLKFNGFGWRGNELRYIFLALCAVLVAVFGIGGIPASIALYIATSAVRHCTLNCRKTTVSHNK